MLDIGRFNAQDRSGRRHWSRWCTCVRLLLHTNLITILQRIFISHNFEISRCGDVMKLQIRVDENGIIKEAKFKTFGCGSAIASSSYMTELVTGMSLDDAGKIKNTEIAKELCLPPVKLHCSSMLHFLTSFFPTFFFLFSTAQRHMPYDGSLIHIIFPSARRRRDSLRNQGLSHQAKPCQSILNSRGNQQRIGCYGLDIPFVRLSPIGSTHRRLLYASTPL